LKKLIIKGMDKRYFSDKIVKWYENNRRKLPWRETKDPYKVWLSEIILQQTRVSQGLPYYKQFIDQFPTVSALAAAQQQEVLRLWQGLGYYTRARNLHKCAKSIVSHHNGRFPETWAELLTLPGIGEYTAAAIASFSFGQSVAVVDGNVFRVLSRIFGIDTPINSPEGKREFSTLANQLISKNHPDEHNQAIMEFGAMFCTPKNPKCEFCPFIKNCFAFNRKMQDQLPVKLKLKKARKRYFYYIVLENNNTLMMKRRAEKDIWLGLFDFYLIEKKKPVKAEKILTETGVEAWVKNANAVTVSKNYKHSLTHQTIFSKFIIVKSRRNPIPKNQNRSFYSFEEIARLPKPVLVSRFLNDHYLL
jgi:A/G-specific adenine glycosylase